MNSNSETSERLKSIGRSYKSHAAFHALLAEEQEIAGDKYLALAARLDAVTGIADLDALVIDLNALNAESSARTDRISALLTVNTAGTAAATES